MTQDVEIPSPMADPVFLEEVADRLLARAREMRDAKARVFGRVVKALRKKGNLSRADLAAKFADPQASFRTIYLLEHGLLHFEELRESFIRELGQALGESPVLLVEASGFGMEELSRDHADTPEEQQKA